MRPLNNSNNPDVANPIPNQIDLLRDSDQPFIYDIRFARKSFTLEIYDTANPNQHWSTLRPNMVVLAFDISNRQTLDGLRGVRHTLYAVELMKQEVADFDVLTCIVAE